MDWLLLAALGIMWVAFLLPSRRRPRPPHASVGEFEYGMELLAQAEAQGASGRWIVTPRKGARFVGTAERKRVRARDRRRQVFTFLLESIGITFLIGVVPPLRQVWTVTMVLGVLLGIYVWLLLAMKQQATQAHPARPGARGPGAGVAPGCVPRPSATRPRAGAPGPAPPSTGWAPWVRATACT